MVSVRLRDASRQPSRPGGCGRCCSCPRTGTGDRGGTPGRV